MLKVCALWLLCALPVVATADTALPDVALVNGVPLVIRMIEVRGAPRQVAARLLARWRSVPAVSWVHHETLQHRTIIAQRRGWLQVTAVLSAGTRLAHTRVLISVLDLRSPLQPVRAPVAVQPAHSFWVSVAQSGPGSAEYLGFTAAAVPQARQRWIRALERSGFSVSVEHEARLAARRKGQAVLLLLRASHGGTAVVLQQRFESPVSP